MKPRATTIIKSNRPAVAAASRRAFAERFEGLAMRRRTKAGHASVAIAGDSLVMSPGGPNARPVRVRSFAVRS